MCFHIGKWWFWKELGHNVDYRRCHSWQWSMQNSFPFCALSTVFHLCHQLVLTQGKSCHPSVSGHTYLYNSWFSPRMIMCKATKRKDEDGLMLGSIVSRLLFEGFFINYKHEYVMFPIALFLDHPSLGIYLWTFFSFAFISCLFP